MSIDIIKRTHNAATYTAREDDKIIVGEMADVSGNLDRISRMRQAGIKSQTLGVVHCSIPLVALSAWCNQIGIGMDEAIANDAILDRFLAEHGKFKVEGGWQ